MGPDVVPGRTPPEKLLVRSLLVGLGFSLVLGLLVGLTPRPGAAADTALRMHHVQVMGTHNSYHRKPRDLAVRWLPAWDYSHEPLPDQLASREVRQFELDIHYDTGAGRFLVHHVTDLDEYTTCAALASCLLEIRRWSDRNPGHLPIYVFLEPKTQSVETGWPGAILPRHDELENTILSVFPRSEVITPDDVRGDSSSLKQAVAEVGWPKLDAVRGKVLFVLWNTGEHRDQYSDTETTLKDRLMFVPTDDTVPPVSGIVKHDDPNDFAAIQREVAANYIVPTRSDAPVSVLEDHLNDLLDRCEEEFGFSQQELQDAFIKLVNREELADEELEMLDTCAELIWEFAPEEAAVMDTYAARHDTALRSGAHLPRTDHPGLDYTDDDSLIQSFDDYGATMPRGNPARCNPVSAPAHCTIEALEEPSSSGGDGGACLVQRLDAGRRTILRLRGLRDRLLTTAPGRSVVRAYYVVSRFTLFSGDP